MNIDFSKIKGYDKLDERRQSVVRNVLAGMPFTRACQLVSLNTSREKANAKLQAVLYHGALRKPEPEAKAKVLDGSNELSIYERAAELQRQQDAAYLAMSREARAACDAGVKAANLARDAASLKAKLTGRVCKGCGRVAELIRGVEAWCFKCQEVKPAVEPPAPVQSSNEAPAPRERNLPSLAHRDAIAKVLLSSYWQRVRAAESGMCQRCESNPCICRRVEQFAL